MAAKKRGLGRGLEALLGASANAADSAKEVDQGALRHLPVERIRRGRYQPRLDMHPDTLGELADSIRAQGMVQPVVVRPVDGGEYELIAGERRWRAAQMAGLAEIPAVVRDVPDLAAAALALIENIQREDLNPLEEAGALARLIDEFGMTHQQAAEAVGRSRTAVTNLLRLLELNDDVKKLVARGDLEMGHARALLTLSGTRQSEAARQVVSRGLSVRETERLVRRLREARPAARAGKRVVDPDIRRLEREISDRLGAPVLVEHQPSGKGRLVIRYSSLDELDGILARLGGR